MMHAALAVIVIGAVAIAVIVDVAALLGWLRRRASLGASPSKNPTTAMPTSPDLMTIVCARCASARRRAVKGGIRNNANVMTEEIEQCPKPDTFQTRRSAGAKP